MGYLQSVKEDVENYMENEMDLKFEIINGEYADVDNLREYLNDTLWICDNVTGNGSGSYFFNREEAKEMVLDNIDDVKEAFDDFGEGGAAFGNRVFADEWEEIDVITRCYFLGMAIDEVLDEFSDDIESAFEEMENQESA